MKLTITQQKRMIDAFGAAAAATSVLACTNPNDLESLRLEEPPLNILPLLVQGDSTQADFRRIAIALFEHGLKRLKAADRRDNAANN